jgi:hypothetical protein
VVANRYQHGEVELDELRLFGTMSLTDSVVMAAEDPTAVQLVDLPVTWTFVPWPWSGLAIRFGVGTVDWWVDPEAGSEPAKTAAESAPRDSQAAGNIRKASPTAATGDDDQLGEVPMHMLPWPELSSLKTYRQRLNWLDDHRAEIPNRSFGRRRMVNAAAFLKHWAKCGKAVFEALDSGENPPVVPDEPLSDEHIKAAVRHAQKTAKRLRKR